MINHRAKDALTDRAIKIYRYLIRGVSVAEIAKIEGIPSRTVYWYAQEGGRILSGEIKQLTKEGLLRELFLRHKERVKELWFLFTSTKQDVVKISCLSRLAEEDSKLLDLAGRMGIIAQQAETPGDKLTIADLIYLESGGNERDRNGAITTRRRWDPKKSR